MAAAIPSRVEIGHRRLQHRPRLLDLPRHGHHGQHHLQGPAGRGAGERTELRHEDIGAGEREADAAQPQEGIALALGRQPRDRLVAAGIEGADGDRPARRPVDEPGVDLELGLLRHAVAEAGREQEFRPRQADAVAMSAGSMPSTIPGSSTLMATAMRRPARVTAGRGRKAASASASTRRWPIARLEGIAGGDTGVLDQAPLLGVEDRRRAAHQPSGAEIEADQQRHAPRPRQDRHMAVGAAAQERAAAIALPVDLQEAGGRQIIGDIDAPLARRQGRSRIGAAGQKLQHPIPEIGEIGRAGAEIIVLRRFVLRHLAIEDLAPGRRRRDPLADREPNRIDQLPILDEGDLEFENGGGLFRSIAGEILQPRSGGLQSGRKPRRLLLGRAGRARVDLRAGMQPDRARGQARARRPCR